MAERPAASGIRAVFDRAHELEAAGRSIVHMEIGRPDYDSPEVAKRAAVAALERGDVHYTANRGLPELREALCERLPGSYDPGTEVVVTAGGSEATLIAAMALAERGDAALVLEPAWPHYAAQLAIAGIEVVRVPCDPGAAFVPDPSRVEEAITERTRLLVVSSPSNPTGAVYRVESLRGLAGVAERHDLRVLSDEIYERFVYGGAEHVSIASLPGMRERTVVAGSFSKTYSMTGWRVGYAAGPADACAAINTLHQYMTVCAPTFAQHGALAALREGEEFVAEMVGSYAQRRAELLEVIASIDALELEAPAGAFYAFPRLASGEDASGVALRLLEDAGVAVVPGGVFGEGFEAHLRLSYAVAADVLAEGAERLRRFFGTPG